MGFIIFVLFVIALLIIGSLSKGSGNKATSTKKQSSRSRQYRRQKQLSDNSEKFWIPKSKTVKINGYGLSEGHIYVGTNLASVAQQYGSNVEPSLINPKLSLNKRNPDYTGSTLTYWPSYSRLDPSARAAYLEWLADGKKDPGTPIGYVFLYYYGLERRLLYDLGGGNEENSQHEVELIKAEIRRLLDIYGSNNSFNRYASQLLDLFQLFDNNQKDLSTALDNENLKFNEYYNNGSYSRRYDLNFKKGLAYYALEEKPLPPDWALKWAVKSSMLNTPAQRCKEKFQDLFRIKYHDKFDEGVILEDYKDTLTFRYKPASSSFNGGISIDTNLPEFNHQKNKYVNKFRKLIDECTDKLDPYSRHLGRNPGDEKSAEAISNLPQEIIKDYLSSDLQGFVNELKEELDNQEYTLVSTNNFTNYWDIKGVNKYRKKESIEIAQFFFKLGYGIEPDLRFGSAKFERDSNVVFFKIDPDNYPKAPSKEYKLALLILQLTTVVGLADGTFSEEEERYLDEYIENLFQLSEAEKKRLNAYLFWLKEENPGVRGIKKKISDLKMDKRKSILDFLIKVANADGYIDPEEVKLLQKTADIFDLDPDQIYHDIHSQQAADDDPVLVMKGEEHEGYSIPDQKLEEKENDTQKLDQDRINETLRKTDEVQSILTDIFEEEEDEPEVNKSEDSMEKTILGLDELHSELVVKLLEKDEWTQMEFENICSELNLFPGGAKEVINDKAFEEYDDALILDFEEIEINTEIAKDIKL
ncbi:TerB N-terminal domain-containing protein [Fodinibius sp. SL11]|uniref:tellurite resistance TerB family protein n=1 Tax=Fodinibius sp. SL11 TaxID=3425690 RepID=UPI003F882ADB